MSLHQAFGQNGSAEPACGLLIGDTLDMSLDSLLRLGDETARRQFPSKTVIEGRQAATLVVMSGKE